MPNHTYTCVMYCFSSFKFHNMKIKLISKDFQHLSENSTYNHNFYKCNSSNMGVVLLEICNEDYNYFSFYLVDGNEQSFLGCSAHGLSETKEVEVEIDFLCYYT